MKSKSMAKWLKFILFGAAACGLAVYLWIIPEMGKTIAAWDNGAFAPFYWPWLIFLWATGVPCFAALVLAWKIAGNIGADRPFSLANVGLLKGIARLAAGEAAFFFLGNVVLLLLNMNHPSVVLCSLLLVFAGAAIAIASAALSHLVRRAAELQEQSDWTI